MDFGALPPEINSTRMHSGAGSTPMVTAASAWSHLAAELNSAADGYDWVITRLASEEWVGPASARMAAAAMPYVEWMRMAALQAEQAANHARSAAAAFENAFAMTVPPPLVAANRSQTASLVSTNVLGQNTPAIAAAQAQYGEMWAQDAAAMYGYAGQSATAAKVTPFTPPPQATNPAGEAGQAAAVGQAVGNSTGTGAGSTSQMITSMPKTLAGLATPAAASDAVGGGLYEQYLGVWDDYGTVIGPVEDSFATPYRLLGTMTSLHSLSKIFAPAAAASGGAAAGAAGAAAGAAGAAGLAGGPVSAGLGAAAQAGKLAVPPSWISAAPGLSAAGAAPLPISSVAAASPQAGGPGNLLGGMPLAGAGAGAGGGAGPKYGFRPTVMLRPPFAG